MKILTAYLISALLALAVIAVSVVGLSRVCTLEGGSSSGGASRLPIHFENSSPEFVIRPLLVQGDTDAKLWLTQAGPQSPWLRRFICDLRATDFALVGFAFFLLLANLFQGLWLRRTAQTTEKTARLVQEGLISAQRAYVFLRDFHVNTTKNPLNDEIQTCTIQPIWENTGTTPTVNGRAHINWRYFERSIPDDFDFADFDELGNRVVSETDYKPLIIGPKSTALSPIFSVEPSMLRQVRDLQGKLLIWGWAEFDEVFADSRRHRTEFCYQLVVSGSPASHVGFSQYKLHNGIDDTCMKKDSAPAPSVAA